MPNLFDRIEMLDAEAAIIAETLSNPTVKKYLQSLANRAATEIVLGSPKDDESAESYLRREARIKGQVEVLTTLLSITPPAKQP